MQKSEQPTGSRPCPRLVRLPDKCQDYLFVEMRRDDLRAHRETKIVAGGSGLIVAESARFPRRLSSSHDALAGHPYASPQTDNLGTCQVIALTGGRDATQ